MEKNDIKIRVNVPLLISYDLLVGGACRDRLLGEFSGKDVIPNDYDLFYCTIDKYSVMASQLTKSRFKITKTWSKEHLGSFCVFQRWKGKYKGRKLQFDVFYFKDDSLASLKEKMKGFVFTCNCCFQTDDCLTFMEMTDDCRESILQKTLDMNCREISLGSLRGRLLRFVKHGWNIDPSVVSFFVHRAEALLDNYERFEKTEKVYIRRISDGYGGHLTLDSKKIFRDLTRLLDCENKIVALLSRNDRILNTAKKHHNTQVSLWSKFLEWFGRKT